MSTGFYMKCQIFFPAQFDYREIRQKTIHTPQDQASERTFSGQKLRGELLVLTVFSENPDAYSNSTAPFVPPGRFPSEYT